MNTTRDYEGRPWPESGRLAKQRNNAILQGWMYYCRKCLQQACTAEATFY